jgi:DNA topoisomerase-2
MKQVHKELDIVTHILNRPMWAGSKSATEITYFSILEKREITVTVIPSLLKMISEIIDNSVDTYIKSNGKNGTHLDITFADNTITVKDNGYGINVVKNNDNYTPKTMFGKPFSSSNFGENDKDKLIRDFDTNMGTNGLGAFITNVFSSNFSVETCDGKNKWSGSWSNNSRKFEKEKVVKCRKRGTIISFTIDTNHIEITDDIWKHTVKYFYEKMLNTIMLYDGINITLNGQTLNGKVGSIIGDVIGDDNLTISKENTTLFIIPNNNSGFSSLTYVNGLHIIGSSKANVVLTKFITESLSKTYPQKYGKLKRTTVEKTVTILVYIKNFKNFQTDSQSKESFKNSEKEITTHFNFTATDMKKVSQNNLLKKQIDLQQNLIEESSLKTELKKKLDNVKIERVSNYWSATKRKDYLIIFEGDSAQNGVLDFIPRDYVGSFPFGGKSLNAVKNSSQLGKNEKLLQLSKVLGIDIIKSNKKSLYKNIVIGSDMDLDGVHITSLIMGFLHKVLPEYVTSNNVFKLKSPIAIVRNSKTDKIEDYVFNYGDLEKWEKKITSRQTLDYKKGLGAISKKEWEDIFSKYKLEEDLLYPIVSTEEDTKELEKWLQQDSDFKKTKVDTQKKRKTHLDYNNVKLHDFLNVELLQYGIYKNETQLPSIHDGLKTVGRKIIYSYMMKINSKKMTVSEGSSVTKNFTQYHHGDSSLEGAISNFAQTYTNNVPLLTDDGAFGSRSNRKSAAPRYAHTKYSDLSNFIFIKEDLDLMEFQTFNGKNIEPKFLLPILPIHTLNGINGIGYGYSSSVLQRNPIDVIDYILSRLNKTEFEKKHLLPWMTSYSGKVDRVSETKFRFYGEWSRKDTKNETIVEITEVPPKYDRESYLKRMNEVLDKELIYGYSERIFENNFYLTVKIKKGFSDNEIEDMLGLVTHDSETLTFIDSNSGKVITYKSVEESVDVFISNRSKYYVKRRELVIHRLKDKIKKFENQIRFIKMMLNFELDFRGKNRKDIGEELKKLNFDLRDGNYTYLLNMGFGNLTTTGILVLEKDLRMLEREKKRMEKQTPLTLWKTDLENLKTAIKDYYTDRNITQ